jgi:eukaryotic-like serine/threonine-protein kinase
VGRLVGGRYRLLEHLGTGGTATVYRARDERLARDVAVKIIADRLARQPLYVRRFRREAQLCARLAHPNIVSLLDVGVTQRDFIVMELVDGLDAGTLLQRKDRLTPGEAVHVVAQTCEALAYAHNHDVVHQDVSARNILIRQPDWAVKLIDFGLASDSLDATARRRTAGTPRYIAPEILRGAGASPRSDLYSLGMVAYRLLGGPAGALPGDSDSTVPLGAAVVRRVSLGDARPDLPCAMSDAVERATADDPDTRHESVAEFRDDLLGALEAPLRRRPAAALLPGAVRAELPSAA